ncbi:MAG: lactonase family protein [Spirochaetales bacterium]|nr:lactonase family protein [Spirochaetales bacterium]
MDSQFLLGSYTDRPGLKHPGKGISLLSLDEDRGMVTELSCEDKVLNPSYLNYDRASGILLAGTENAGKEGTLSTFRIKEDNSFRPISSIEGPGPSNCHVNRDPSRDLAFATSYKGGSLKVYSMDGAEVVENILYHFYEGKGPNEARQEQPHAHQAVISPNGRYLYVADLGSDTLWIHDLDALTGPPRPVKTSSGLGPRHMVFHPVSGRLYVVCELIATLLVFDWNEVDGNLTLLQEVRTADEQDIPTAQPSGIKIHPSGKTIALANRFTDTISVFDINEETGLAEKRNTFPGRGVHCRDLEFSFSGKWLLLAHQESCDIQLCAFDGKTGQPTGDWGKAFVTGSPTCLVALT